MKTNLIRIGVTTSTFCLLAIFPGRAAAQDAAKTEAQTILIEAADLAPADLRSEQPQKGKWWLKRDARDWGAPHGILMTGRPNETPIPVAQLKLFEIPTANYFVPYRLPAFEIDPKAKGWYRLHVGLYHGGRALNIDELQYAPQLWARLSGEPYPEYLRTPSAATTKTAEVYWKAADLTGKKIRIEQPPAPMPFPGHGWVGGISHVKLVPMSDQEVADAKKEIVLPPINQRLFGLLDYTDEIFWLGTSESAEDTRATLYRHYQAGFGVIYWRVWGTFLDTSHEVPDAQARWTEADEERWCKAHKTKAAWMPYVNLPKKFDALKVAADYGKELGVEVHAMLRLTNFNREPYAEFWHKNPQFRMQVLSKDPKTGLVKRSPFGRVLSFAYPEVRAFYVKMCKQFASTGVRGIMFDLLRHPPMAGYEPIVADAFKNKYGIDMESLAGKDSRDALTENPMIAEFLSGYLEEFLREVRREVGKDIEISVRSRGPSKFGLRGADFIKSGLIDTIVDGNYYSGNGPRPTIGETIAAVGKTGKAYALAEYTDVDPKNAWKKREGLLSPEAILALAEIYRAKGVHRFGIYESNELVWYPEARRAIRRAGWDFIRKEARPSQ